MYDIWKLSPGVVLLAVAHIIILSLAAEISECRQSTSLAPEATNEIMRPDPGPK